MAKTGLSSTRSRRSLKVARSSQGGASGATPEVEALLLEEEEAAEALSAGPAATPGTWSAPAPRATVTQTGRPCSPRSRRPASSPDQPAVEVPSTKTTRSPGRMPARSAGEPAIGARTTSRPDDGSVASSSPTPPGTAPSEAARNSRYSSGESQRVYGSPSGARSARTAPRAAGAAGDSAAATAASPSERRPVQSAPPRAGSTYDSRTSAHTSTSVRWTAASAGVGAAGKRSSRSRTEASAAAAGAGAGASARRSAAAVAAIAAAARQSAGRAASRGPRGSAEERGGSPRVKNRDRRVRGSSFGRARETSSRVSAASPPCAESSWRRPAGGIARAGLETRSRAPARGRDASAPLPRAPSSILRALRTRSAPKWCFLRPRGAACAGVGGKQVERCEPSQVVQNPH